MNQKNKRIPKMISRVVLLVVILAVLFFLFKDEVHIGKIHKVNEADITNENYRIIDIAKDEGFTDINSFRNENGKEVVLFTSTWCGTCEYLKTVLKSQSELYINLNFFIVDIDSNRDLAEELNVYITPTVVMIDEMDAAYESGINKSDLESDLNFFSTIGVSGLPISYKKFQ